MPAETSRPSDFFSHWISDQDPGSDLEQRILEFARLRLGGGNLDESGLLADLIGLAKESEVKNGD